MIEASRRIDPIIERTTSAHLLFESDRFRGKLMTAMARIEVTFRDRRRPYVALSGGKDSLAVCSLVEVVADRLGREIAMHWSDGEIEYPETVAFIEQFAGNDQLFITGGKDSTHGDHQFWFEPWHERPFWREPVRPGMIVRPGHSDEWMAARGHDCVFLGLRATESNQRRKWLTWSYLNPDSNRAWHRASFGTGARCSPIWDWTEDDVWALIVGWRLPYNAAYDVMERIGIARERQRVGPMTVTPRAILAEGWPDLLARLEARYGNKWI